MIMMNMYIQDVCNRCQLWLQRAVVNMSRETEQNISRILRDVRRHSDASQTGLTSSGGSFSGMGEAGMSSSSSLSCDNGGTSQSSASLSEWFDYPGTSEETPVGVEPITEFTSGTSLNRVTRSASVSSMDVVDGTSAAGVAEKPLFYIDNEGEGRGTLEAGASRNEEADTKLNDTLKLELEEKERSNTQYKKMMVSLTRQTTYVYIYI